MIFIIIHVCVLPQRNGFIIIFPFKLISQSRQSIKNVNHDVRDNDIVTWFKAFKNKLYIQCGLNTVNPLIS